MTETRCREMLTNALRNGGWDAVRKNPELWAMLLKTAQRRTAQGRTA